MIEKVFYNVFVFGTIISICISPVLIFLYKNKYKYKLKNIYKVFAVFLLLLILPINNFEFSNIKDVLKKQEISSVEKSFIAPIEAEIILDTGTTIVELSDSINIKNNDLSNFAQFVPYLWIFVGMIFLFYNLFMYWIYLYKDKKNYIEIKNPELEEKINKICKNVNLKNISYTFSKSITTPMVVGIFKKKIVLPVNIVELENYEMILMHEIVHIKNKDIECKFILLLINSIYWFNPVIYKLIDQVEEVLELKCDEIVLENQPQIYKIKYAQVLLNQIEENRNLKHGFSLNFANKRRNIMKRFSNIVDRNKKKNMIGISYIVASVIIISSAIIFSFPNINFASIQEEAFDNEVNNNLVIQEEVFDNEVDNNLIIQENVIEEESTISENTIAENVADDTSNEEGSVKKMVTAAIPELICPLEKGIVTSRFGKRSNGTHTGIDINAVPGTPIKAAASGTVVYSAYKGSYGYLVIIDHGNEFQTYYAHCSKLHVTVNQEVKQGELIAEVGSSGNTTGPQLHFETRNNRIPVNPQSILNFDGLNP